MRLVKVNEIFDVQYGNSLELNRLKHAADGINFVSRTSKNNGVSAKVAPIKGLEPSAEGKITVALGGSVLETFLQPELFYCSCIAANKYRYNYGRQANRTLRDLLIPAKEEVPDWVKRVDAHRYDDADKSFTEQEISALDTTKWKWFQLQELFSIKKGKRLTKANMIGGDVPFIGSIDSNNGYREYIGQEPIHTGKTITVNYNGSVAEAFYQPKPFWASDDVNVLYPKFEMNHYIALFFVTLIKIERYRFNYGRKWHM